MNQNLPSWKCDVNVLLIFFIRDAVLKETFEAVRKARPRRLLLWQDGARTNRPDDIEKVQKCREIVENIDWDCEVYKNYQTRNWGCDPSTFFSHKWAFSIVDKCIVLEDDAVPSQSFFLYCKELLDKYENDNRVSKICGMNQVASYKVNDSYLFTTVGSLGWASWKRVADTWDEHYTFLDDPHRIKLYNELYHTYADKQYLKLCKKHRDSGRPHWETIQTFARIFNNQLNIVPAVNMIHNIGLGEDSTHSKVSLKTIDASKRDAFYQVASDIDFPLKHPGAIIDDVGYLKAYYKQTGQGTSAIGTFFKRVQRILRRIFGGDMKGVWKSAASRFNFK